MSLGLLDDLEAALTGRACSVERREHDWLLDLGEGMFVAVSVPWRIVFEGRIAFARDDDAQLFGRSVPVDGEDEARRLLGTKLITKATVDRQTGDLALHFGPETRLDVFNNSIGYEGWKTRYAIGGLRWFAIALGGGEMAFLREEG